jgi:hypothetical protein
LVTDAGNAEAQPVELPKTGCNNSKIGIQFRLQHNGY